jgi:hypothetical protein
VVLLSKAGGTFATAAGSVTECTSVGTLTGFGWYKVAGNATDTNTLGSLVLHASAANCDPVDIIYEVVAFDPQDAVRQGLAALPNATATASGGLLTFGTGTGQINSTMSGSVNISAGLKKGQPLANIEFLMTDSTNHAPATSATVSVTRSIDGLAFSAGTLSTPANVSNGIYRFDAAGGDTNGSCITFKMTASGCDDQFLTIFPQP